MEVQIISNECIKPCSSMPHPKTFKFSLLDQFMAPIVYSNALFYPNTNNNNLLQSSRSHLLKHSLSATLSDFYPLAGKIKDFLSIDCNDEGALYTVARANIPMVTYLTQPDFKLLSKFVPNRSLSHVDPVGAFVVMVQETTFSCGGLVLGVSVSHKALDGTAFASFIKAWASAASSSKQITIPNLDSPSVFPQHDPFPKEAAFTSLWSSYLRKVGVTRLTFDASSLDQLKAEATSTSVEKPSRVEVVSALIVKSVMAAFNAPISITHAVNIRRKATPPFPDCSLGNFIWLAPATFTQKESQVNDLVYKIRSALRKVDSDFVEEIEYVKLLKEVKEIKNEQFEKEIMLFTSWCNFGLYKNSDFGWGNPNWIAPCGIIDSEEIRFTNMSILNDTISGNGIEAWVYLPQHVATAMKKDDQLLQYASIN